MNELLAPSSSTSRATHHPLLLGNIISAHSSLGLTTIQIDASGSQKFWKVGKVVEKLGKRLGKISRSHVTVAGATTIDILPDDILLQIFDFCRVDYHPLDLPVRPVVKWHRLIHVCRSWRQIICSSPCRLNLYLLCEHGTPFWKTLALWPAFPIIVHYDKYLYRSLYSDDEDNIIAALEHPDRVLCLDLKLPITISLLEKMTTVAQEPFPMLTQLWLSSEEGSESVLPSAFLGGSAPRLREIHLEGIIFPTLPRLLSSASDLVSIYLHRIPHAGYISPEAMVASLGTLPRLHDLSIEFQSSPLPNQSDSSRTRPAPATRVVLPALTLFRFQGASEYLEDLMAQIAAPLLASTRIKYFNQLFPVPQLFRFISQTQIIEQACTMNAEVHFYHSLVKISLSSGLTPSREIYIEISCQRLDLQVSQLAKALSQSSMELANVHSLFILMDSVQPGRNNVDNVEWLALLRRFTAVETLLVSPEIACLIADALKDVTAAMAPGILPALRLLYLFGERVGCVEEFVTARQLSGLPPITIH